MVNTRDSEFMVPGWAGNVIWQRRKKYKIREKLMFQKQKNHDLLASMDESLSLKLSGFLNIQDLYIIRRIYEFYKSSNLFLCPPVVLLPFACGRPTLEVFIIHTKKKTFKRTFKGLQVKKL